MERARIAFVHIPRTGGMSFGAILNALYERQEVCDFYGDDTHSVVNDKLDHFRTLDTERKNAYAVLKGHFAFEFDRDLSGFRYVTLLREPLRRLISYYFYALKERRNYLHPLLMQRRLKLETFLTSDLSIELDNYQVRAVCGAALLDPLLRVTEEHLELAKHNLREGFAAFGLTECFERSMEEFASQFGWDLPGVERRNSGGDRARNVELSGPCAALVGERNRFDIELYRYARQLFAARIGRNGGEAAPVNDY